MIQDLVLKVVTSLITPFILIYGLYLQINAEHTPGGGFQAGAILASGFILNALVNDSKQKKISFNLLKFLACFGVLLYMICGLIPIYLGYQFLEFSIGYHAQKYFIFVVEIAIGISIFASLLLIYYIFTKDE